MRVLTAAGAARWRRADTSPALRANFWKKPAKDRSGDLLKIKPRFDVVSAAGGCYTINSMEGCLIGECGGTMGLDDLINFMRVDGEGFDPLGSNGGVSLHRDGTPKRVAFYWNGETALEKMKNALHTAAANYPTAKMHLIGEHRRGVFHQNGELTAFANAAGFGTQTIPQFLDSDFRQDEHRKLTKEMRDLSKGEGGKNIAQPYFKLGSLQDYPNFLRSPHQGTRQEDIEHALLAGSPAALSQDEFEQRVENDHDFRPDSPRLTIVVAGAAMGKTTAHLRAFSKKYKYVNELKDRVRRGTRCLAVTRFDSLQDEAATTPALFDRILKTYADANMTEAKLRFLVEIGAAELLLDGVDEVVAGDESFFPTLLEMIDAPGSRARITVFIRDAALQGLESFSRDVEPRIGSQVALLGLARWDEGDLHRLGETVYEAGLYHSALTRLAQLIGRGETPTVESVNETPDVSEDEKTLLLKIVREVQHDAGEFLAQRLKFLQPSVKADEFVAEIRSKNALKHCAGLPWTARKLAKKFFTDGYLPDDDLALIEEIVLDNLDREQGDNKILFTYLELLPPDAKGKIKEWSASASSKALADMRSAALALAPSTVFDRVRGQATHHIVGSIQKIIKKLERWWLGKPQEDREQDAAFDVNRFLAELARHRCRSLVEELAHALVAPVWSHELNALPRREVIDRVGAWLVSPPPIAASATLQALDLDEASVALLEHLSRPQLSPGRRKVICDDMATFAFFAAAEGDDALRLAEGPVAEYLAGAAIADRLLQERIGPGDATRSRDFADPESILRRSCFRRLDAALDAAGRKALRKRITDAIDRRCFMPAEKNNLRELAEYL